MMENECSVIPKRIPCSKRTPPMTRQNTRSLFNEPKTSQLLFLERLHQERLSLFHQTHRQLSWLVLWLLMWSFPTTALFHNVEFPNHAYYGVCGPGDRLPPSNLQYFNSSYGLPMEHGQSKLQKKPAGKNGRRPHGLVCFGLDHAKV